MTATLEPGIDRTPPHDAHAEQCVLGGMLISGDAIAGVLDTKLTAADFYIPKHADIYNALLDLYGRGEPADALTLVRHLPAATLQRIGGAPYLHTLTRVVPLAANAPWYARIVVDRAEDRRYIEAGAKLARLGYADRDPDNPKANQATSIVYDAIVDTGDDDLVPIGDRLDDVLRAIEAGTELGLTTGYSDLDRLTQGLAPGQVWVWAARPGMGKSVALADLARHVAFRQKLPVAYFSLEMGRDQLIRRILSAESGIPLHLIKQGGSSLSDNDYTTLVRLHAELNEAPLYVDQSTGLTITDIAAKARRRAARQPLSLIVVDYLQLMGNVGGGRNDSREREVARISRGLKILAKQLNIPIVVAAQLNRENEKRSDKRPAMSDLRESGSIENDADFVILIHRDDYYDKDSPRAGEVDLIVAKNRDGSTGTITVAAQLHLSRFVDMAI